MPPAWTWSTATSVSALYIYDMVFPVQNNATCMDMINSYECVCSLNLIWCSLCRTMPHAWTWSTATSVSASAGSGQPIQLVLLYTKEYTYITRRRDSNIPSSFNNLTHPTSPRLLCWQLYRRTGSPVYCRQSRERLGESIYSLLYTAIQLLWMK